MNEKQETGHGASLYINGQELPVNIEGLDLLFEPITPREKDVEYIRWQECMWLMQARHYCPFSIINEFEQWWEWHYRVRVEGQTTGFVTVAMLKDDLNRVKRHQKALQFGIPASMMVQEPRDIIADRVS